MARAFECKVESLSELTGLLRQLPRDLQARAVRNATRAGARVLQAAAARAAPVRQDNRLKPLRPRLTRAAERRIVRRIQRAGGGGVRLTRAERSMLAPSGLGPTRGPGFLRSRIGIHSIRVRRGVIIGRVGAGQAFYGKFVERRRPFFKRAVEAAFQPTVQAMAEALRAGIEGAIQRLRVRR